MIDWRPIESLPATGAEFMFWLDWADDCAELNPPLGRYDHRTRLFIGKFRCWGSTYQAVAWALLPEPPRLCELQH